MKFEHYLNKDVGAISLRYGAVLRRNHITTYHRYHERFGYLLTHIQKKMCDKELSTVDQLYFLIDDIANKHESGFLSHVSLRQYKASINHALACLCAIKNGDFHMIAGDNLPFYEELAKGVSLEEIDDVSLRLVDLGSGSNNDIKARNIKASEKNRTSSQRMKHMPRQIYELIMKDKHPRRALLREFVFFNCIFGLRPKEWLSAKLLSMEEYKQLGIAPPPLTPTPFQQQTILKKYRFDAASMSDDGDTQCVLMIKNGKNSLNRACGEYRYLHLTLGPKTQLRLRIFIDTMQILNPKPHFESYNGSKYICGKEVLDSLQAQLKYFLTKKESKRILKALHAKKKAAYNHRQKKAQALGKAFNGVKPTFQHPTLYSTRHQAIANQKQAGVDDIHIAAIFGHISPYTAKKEYANKKFGASGVVIKPDSYNLGIIVANLMENIPPEQSKAPQPQISNSEMGLQF